MDQNSIQTHDSNKHDQKSFFDSFCDITLSYPLLSCLVGLLIIVGGTWLTVIHDHVSSPQVIMIMVISHFAIIFGEAVFVLFLLHRLVEKRNHEKNHSEIQGLLGEFRARGKEITDELNENLFSAIMKSIIPYQLIGSIKDSKIFNTKIIRHNSLIKYKIKTEESTKTNLAIEQKIEFEMENVSKEVEYWDMELQIGGTPVVNYTMLYAGYKGERDDVYKEIDVKTGFEEVNLMDNVDYKSLKLKKRIEIKPGEKVWVRQIVQADYSLTQNGAMIDYYFCTKHTTNLSIVFELGDGYDHKVFPTFVGVSLPTPDVSLNETRYDKIKFLIPGQGFSFSIFKKDIHNPELSNATVEKVLDDIDQPKPTISDHIIDINSSSSSEN